MDPRFTFRNIEATDGIRSHTAEKLKKLNKFLLKPVDIHVILQVEKFRHIAEITVAANGHHYIGIGESNDLYPSIDDAVTKILTQIRKDREKLKEHKTR